MEVSRVQQTGFGCFGSYDSRPSFSKDPFLSCSYEDHEMSYECESTAHSNNDSEDVASESVPSSSSSYSDDYDEVMDMEMDDCKDVDQGDVYELAASTEMLRIRFPFQSISIRLSDFCCLQPKDLLNDTIVDFCLNHIVEHILPDDPSRRVTVLPSVFYHNLSLLDAASHHEDVQNLSPEKQLDARFGDVLEFVEGFDLQEVDYIVIPVNEWDHWSLAVVCHPFTANGRIVYFDSKLTEDLNNVQNISNLINEFLKYAWLRWRGEQCQFSLSPSIPRNLAQQENTFDCGVYLLEFARRFLLSPPQNLDSFDFAAEYQDFTIVNCREEMQRAVLALCSNRSVWEPLMTLLNRQN
jgi:Ulp1 family protease